MNQQDCTSELFRFRELMRVVWNIGFAAYPHLLEADAMERFREAEACLFEAIVGMSLGWDVKSDRFDTYGLIANIRVTAYPLPAKLIVKSASSGGGSHFWGEPTINLGDDHHRLRFVRLFDFGEIGYRDFQYVMVRIDSLPKAPELQGREALLQCIHCRFWSSEKE